MIVFNTGDCKLRTIFSKTPLSMKKFASFSSNFPGGIIFGKILNYLRVFIVVEFISRFVLERVIYYAETREDKRDREGIPHTHPIPQVIRLELFLESG